MRKRKTGIVPTWSGAAVVWRSRSIALGADDAAERHQADVDCQQSRCDLLP